MAAGRCLSDLPDDLLRHILFFAPAREGATTAVLSRRWRWLWRTSGAVNLDSRSSVSSRFFPEDQREAFFRGAEKALSAAAAGPIRRLTFTITADSKINLTGYRYVESGWTMEAVEEENVMEAIMSNPMARNVEELQIDVKNMNASHKLSFWSLPSEALRVLRLTNCATLTAPAPPPPGAATAAAAFPMLVDLHLQKCSVSVVDFQAIFDAAPRLSTLRLESSVVSLKQDTTIHDDDDDDDDKLVIGRLLLPGVTALVLADCMVAADYCPFWKERRLELDVPRLQYFRYKGSVQQTETLSLKPPPPQVSSNMIQVDLEVTYDFGYYNNRWHPTPPCNLFWQFIQNFTTAKLLKIKLDDHLAMDHLALIDKASRDKLLVSSLPFYLLEQLELEAKYNYKPGFKPSMVMLADLLHRCPRVRDLQLRFGKKHEVAWRIESSIDKEAGLHFDKSFNGFRNRRTKSSMISLLAAGQKNDVNYEAIGIPSGLTGEHSFSCLQSHLQRVSLHFFMDEPNCLGLQLAKFFAENAMVLQEMHIYDGSQEMLEHANSSLRRWIANTHNGNNQLNVKD